MTARVIVMEREGRWAAALRRAAGRRKLPLVETRSLEQVERELAEFPASAVVLEVGPDNVFARLRRLAQWRSRWGSACFVLAASPAMAAIEASLREAGAAHVEYSPRHLRALARLIRRHLGKAPLREIPLKEAVWARLPWRQAAGR
jgi:hypothetical protein